MKIPILSEESRESLITEMVNNQGAEVYQRLLDLAEKNPVLYNIIRHLACQFPTKEMYDTAALCMAAIVHIIESELERENLEKIYFAEDKK